MIWVSSKDPYVSPDGRTARVWRLWYELPDVGDMVLVTVTSFVKDSGRLLAATSSNRMHPKVNIKTSARARKCSIVGFHVEGGVSACVAAKDVLILIASRENRSCLASAKKVLTDGGPGRLPAGWCITQ